MICVEVMMYYIIFKAYAEAFYDYFLLYFDCQSLKVWFRDMYKYILYMYIHFRTSITVV